jgi:hypothetical protein
MNMSYEELELELWKTQVQLLQQLVIVSTMKGERLLAQIAEREQWLTQAAQSTPSSSPETN